jgi:hypothetical protein
MSPDKRPGDSTRQGRAPGRFSGPLNLIHRNNCSNPMPARLAGRFPLRYWACYGCGQQAPFSWWKVVTGEGVNAKPTR